MQITVEGGIDQDLATNPGQLQRDSVARAEEGGTAARKLGIAKVYESHDDLLAIREIDAIYNSLPESLACGVVNQGSIGEESSLCEKPLSLTVAEAKTI